MEFEDFEDDLMDLDDAPSEQPRGGGRPVKVASSGPPQATSWGLNDAGSDIKVAFLPASWDSVFVPLESPKNDLDS